MDSKVCKTCGWVYPATQTGYKCTICGTPFESTTCSICGKLIPVGELTPGRTFCRPCHNARDRLYQPISRQRWHAKLDKRFDEWLAKIRQVPKNYPTLTEAQWIEACRYFGGCARCSSTDIEARGFFIGFDLGGRYCDWNVIPLCERCAKSWQLTANPFKTAVYRERYATVAQEYRNGIENISRYLEGKLNDAIRATKLT